MREFLIRRALRILPLYYPMLGIMWPLRASRSSDPGQDLLRHLTFTHIFDDRYLMSIILPAWSLAVEVIVYGFMALFGPLIYLLRGRLSSREGRARLIGGLLVAIALISVGYKCCAYCILRIPVESLSVYSGPLAKADTFALGMGLAVVIVMGRVRFAGWSPTWVFRGGLGMMAALFLLHGTDDPLDIAYHEFSSIAFVSILASTVLATHEPPWKRWLLSTMLQLFGRISYSIFLWHELVVIVLLSALMAFGLRPAIFPFLAVAVLGCSIGLAALSYRLIERPIMRQRQRQRVGS